MWIFCFAFEVSIYVYCSRLSIPRIWKGSEGHGPHKSLPDASRQCQTCNPRSFHCLNFSQHGQATPNLDRIGPDNESCIQLLCVWTHYLPFWVSQQPSGDQTQQVPFFLSLPCMCTVVVLKLVLSDSSWWSFQCTQSGICPVSIKSNQTKRTPDLYRGFWWATRIDHHWFRRGSEVFAVSRPALTSWSLAKILEQFNLFEP